MPSGTASTPREIVLAVRQIPEALARDLVNCVTDGRLILSVNDEGKGIADLDLPRIFEVFRRGAEAPPGGTGLGLAIVDGFVRAHGGSVAAVNRLPHGAEFVITIPVETLRSDVLESFA